MGRRERDEVASVARRRLELLGAELSGLRLDDSTDRDDEAPAPPGLTAGGPAGLPARTLPASGQGQAVRDDGATPVPSPGRHARARRDPPGTLLRGWWADRVPGALRGRVALSSQHTAVVVALVGVALALAGWVALRSGADDATVPRAHVVGSTTSATAPSGAPSSGARSSGAASSSGPSPGASAGSSSGSQAGSVVVDVAGRVRHPGIVTLPAGSRVQDALRRAGGARAGTRLTSLNLARVLVDGEQILVGQAAPAGAAPSAAGSTPGPAGGLVNINSAGLGELDTLPGVGPVTAQKILDWRGAHGAFTSVDELLEVDGIGDKTLADIAPHVTL